MWFARTTFLPTLAYNLMRNRWTNWNWFDRIDQRVVLGALPFHGSIAYKLLNVEQISSVISMNENFELHYPVVNAKQWSEMGVQYLQLNTPDILHAPSQQQLRDGVQFIMEQTNGDFELKRSDTYETVITSTSIPWKINWHNRLHSWSDESDNTGSVYIHCKAGRTRSATLVACYLIKRYNLTPKESVQYMKSRRPQVFLHTKQWQAIEQFYDEHRHKSSCDALIDKI